MEVVEAFGEEALAQLGEEVAVAIEGDGDGGVAETPWDACAPSAEEGGAGVPEIVEPGLGRKVRKRRRQA